MIKNMKIADTIHNLLPKLNLQRFFSSGLKMSGIIILIVAVVVTLFLFTGRVFVELFGWLVFPFPRRAIKKKA
jgi:hypothetical protein